MILNEKTIRISEIFGPTIQGEGALIGVPTVFVRTGGCDYRCTWCDTLYAVESKYRNDWLPMSARDIMDKVQELSGDKPLLITLSGGNPANQDCSELVKLGHNMGYSFAIETQGSIAQDWFTDIDHLTLSPKPPSSGMKTNWQRVQDCINAAGDQTKISLKIVITDDTDYAYAKEAHKRFPDLQIYLQPCNPYAGEDSVIIEGLNTAMHKIMDSVNADKWYSAIILPQLHVYLWGNERGV